MTTTQSQSKDPVGTIFNELKSISTPWSRATEPKSFVTKFIIIVAAASIIWAPFAVYHVAQLPMPWSELKPVPTTPAEIISKENQKLTEIATWTKGWDKPCPTEGCTAQEAAARLAIRDRLTELQIGADADLKTNGAGALNTEAKEQAKKSRFGIALAVGLALAALSVFHQLRVTARFWEPCVWRNLRPTEDFSRYTPAYLSVLVPPIFTIALLQTGLPLTGIVVILFLALIFFPYLRLKTQDRFNKAHTIWAPFQVAGFAAAAGILSEAYMVQTIGPLLIEPSFFANLGLYGTFTLLVLLVALFAMAGFTNHAAGENFPPIMKSRDLYETIRKNRASLAGESLFKEYPKSPNSLALWQKLDAHRIGMNIEDLKPVPAFPKMSPAASNIIVSDVSRLLAINVVVCLLVVSLAIDVVTPVQDTDAFDAIASAYKLNFLLLLTVITTVLLGIVYLHPSIRIRPYEEAADSLPKPKDEEVAATRKTFESLSMAYDEDKKTSLALGCTKERLDLIYAASSYGGGLHAVMKAKGNDWLKGMTTLLAPAFATGLLAIFG